MTITDEEEATMSNEEKLSKYGQKIWEELWPYIASEDPPDSGSAEKDLEDITTGVLPRVMDLVSKLDFQITELRKLLEKESLFDEVFIERFHKYSDHDRGCTWDDATKGDVCTCGFQALVSEFFEIKTAKKAAVDERELLEPRMPSQNIFLYGMAQLPVASSRTEPYEPFLTWAIEFAASEKREEGLRDIVKAGLVLAEGIGTEIGTSPLHPNSPDATWEDALMTLAIEFKSVALEALKEPKP